MKRFFGFVATGIGIATGGAAIVGAIVHHFDDVTRVALPVAVWTCCSLIALAAFLWLLDSLRDKRWPQRVAEMVGFLAVVWTTGAGLVTSPRAIRIGIGGFYVGACVVAAVLGLNDAATSRAAARKVCPDCAETVKSAANVCRYCGYRWSDANQ